MLDILGIGLFAPSRGKVAAQKGHPAGSYAILSGALGFGGEILGATAGFFNGGNGMALMLGIVGALVGCGIAAVVVGRLLDVRYPDRMGPSSMKAQIAGSLCATCQGNILSALDGRLCPTCGETVHHACEAAHVEATHANKPAKAKKKKAQADGTLADAA